MSDKDKIFVLSLNKDQPMIEMDLGKFMAIGRADDCDCRLIQCVCEESRKHKKDCKYRVALTCAVPIECDHGYDVCPECDVCYCKDEGNK